MARYVRVIVYDGTPEWLERQKESSKLVGVMRMGAEGSPREAVMASYWLTPNDTDVERLQEALEGECDGLGITEAQARAVLEHVFARLPR